MQSLGEQPKQSVVACWETTNRDDARKCSVFFLSVVTFRIIKSHEQELALDTNLVQGSDNVR